MLDSLLRCTILLLIFVCTDCVTICISTLSGISNYAKTSSFVGIVDKYLQSNRIVQENGGDAKTIGGDKLVYIPCASYAPTPESTRSLGEQRRRARHEGRHKMALLKDLFGLKKTCLLEIDDMKIDEGGINDALNDASMVYIDGGNTFYLQYHLNRVNFWNIAKKYPNFLLIGSSAGGIVCGKSIITSYYKGWDDPEIASGHIWNDANLRGSCSLPFLLFMHYDKTSHHDLVMQKTMEYAAEGDTTICLSDNHALIDDGVDVRIIDSNGVTVTHDCESNIWFPR